MTRQAVRIAAVWMKGKTEKQAENGKYKAANWKGRVADSVVT